jgi:hypothetical protein
MQTDPNDSCKDCRFFLPVDVFKGLCKISKEPVAQESESCTEFDRIPKCRYCRHFTPEKDHLGKCREKVLAYPDMIAVNCTGFEWIGQN